MPSLAELELNRQLYKTQPQTVETLTADQVASNLPPSPSTAVASGNTVSDVNTNSEQLNGAVIAPGTIPPSTLNIANFGWTQTCAFSVSDSDTVAWGSGTFTSADGSSVYSIGAGNTGNMAARTYIYLDINVSTTAYQISTSITAPIGIGKVLIAVAENGSPTATYNLVQAHQIVGDNVIANTLNANRIVAGSITATQISASYVYAGTIEANQINAGTITGMTIVGSTLSTATTGQRVVLTTTLAQFYNSSNTQVGTIFGETAGMAIASDSGLLRLSAASGNTVIVTVVGASDYTIFDLDNSRIIPNSNGGLDLGASGAAFSDIYAIGTFRYRAVDQPVQYHGYCSGTSISRDNVPSWSLSNPSTGNYTVTHNLSSSDYTVQVTALRASGAGAYVAKVAVLNTNSFGVIVFDDGGIARDSDFMFLLLEN